MTPKQAREICLAELERADISAQARQVWVDVFNNARAVVQLRRALQAFRTYLCVINTPC